MDNNYDKKIARYDELFKGFLAIAATVTLVGLGILGHQLLELGEKIDANVQKNANYTKCLVLYPKKNPKFNYEAATLKETETVLDNCAKVE